MNTTPSEHKCPPASKELQYELEKLLEDMDEHEGTTLTRYWVDRVDQIIMRNIKLK